MNFLFKHNVKNFDKHKKNLIDLIYKIPQNPLKTISHTDWNLPETMRREYVEYIINQKIIEDYLDNFRVWLNPVDCPIDFKIKKLWFQIYKKNDHHPYHTHGETNFSGVFYINLPNISLKTEIKLPGNNTLDFEVSEGQIITFPAIGWHKSPVNTSIDEKIVIAFNLDLLSR